METRSEKPAWWCSASIRICHRELDPKRVSEMLNVTPQIAQRAGESRVPHGDCKSAGYWCLSHRIEDPNGPDSVFLWVEEFIREREPHFRRMLERGYSIDVYIGIHTNLLALGFDLPIMPAIWKLAIPVGIEFFAG
jgi:hypothetical protein